VFVLNTADRMVGGKLAKRLLPRHHQRSAWTKVIGTSLVVVLTWLSKYAFGRVETNPLQRLMDEDQLTDQVMLHHNHNSNNNNNNMFYFDLFEEEEEYFLYVNVNINARLQRLFILLGAGTSPCPRPNHPRAVQRHQNCPGGIL
jgi:hypothetical protein